MPAAAATLQDACLLLASRAPQVAPRTLNATYTAAAWISESCAKPDAPSVPVRARSSMLRRPPPDAARVGRVPPRKFPCTGHRQLSRRVRALRYDRLLSRWRRGCNMYPVARGAGVRTPDCLAACEPRNRFPPPTAVLRSRAAPLLCARQCVRHGDAPCARPWRGPESGFPQFWLCSASPPFE